MLNPEHISIGRLKKAYGLNDNEAENVIQALWPDAVFPVELWRREHEIYWRGFADSNQAVHGIESSSLPEINLSAKYFHPHLCALDVQTFFRKLSLNIQTSTLREGLNFILEESYEDSDAVFPEERAFLFSALERLETTDVFEQYSQASELFEEKILSVPTSSYHFIANIFPDTMLVDTAAVIRILRNYPLRQEVKGITQRLVDFVLNSSAPETLDVPETGQSSNSSAEVIMVPRSLWKGKPPATVRDAMKDDYSLPVVAYVLVNWCKIDKTQVGRLLSKKHYKEDKSYRNLVDRFLEEAASFTILEA